MNQKKFSFFLSLIFFLLINNLFSAEKSVKKIKDNIEVYKTTKSKKQIKIIKDELVIKFKESVSESKKNNLLKTHKLTKLKRNQKLRNEKIKISTGKKVKDIIDILKKNKDIEYIEPNYVIEASEIANDSYYSEQWGLKKIEIEEAWKINEGENDVIIAVLDSGLDLAHLDLQANIKSSYDFVNDDADASDDNGHGSMVAGIIGAVKNNSIGISGVAPKCKIMPLKVLDSEGYGTYADVADAIIYAADNGAKVINLSLGGYAYSQYLQDAINYAFNKNCVIVASAGNNNTDEPFYPAACANVISVSSINKDNNKSTFANYGNYIDLVAPGEQIISCDLNNNYRYGNGTSYSAPFVSGVAGLLFSANKNISNLDLMSKLFSSAKDLGQTGYDNEYGYGLIDAYAALKADNQNSNIKVTYETQIVVISNNLRQILRPLTDEEFNELKRITGTYEEGKNYNQKINGFGTGLRPPTEEEWQELRKELLTVEKLEYADAARQQELPTSYDNSTSIYFPPVANQGSKGSCISFSLGYYTKTYQEARERGWNLSGASWVSTPYPGYVSTEYQDKIFSPDFLYHLINNGEDNGSYYTDNGKILSYYGICSWSRKPTNDTECTSFPTELAWREAPLNRTAGNAVYVTFTIDSNLTTLKTILSNNNLAVISVNANSYPTMTTDSDLWTKNNYDTSVETNHANTIVGYNDNFGPYYEEGEWRYGAVKVINSWGTNWDGDYNNDGFYYISYAALKDYVQSYYYISDSVSYNPKLVGVIKIDHNKRNENIFTIGTNTPSSPDKTKVINDRKVFKGNWGAAAYPNNKLVFDITELYNYLSSNKVFMQVYDSTVTSTYGTVYEFEIEFYDNYDSTGKADTIFVSTSVPVNTVDGNTVSLYITINTVPIQNNVKTITSAYHTITIDGVNDFYENEKIDSCITESNWSSANDLDTLYFTYAAETIYIGVKGKVESSNYIVVYFDRDFGNNTGVKNFSLLTDESGNPDAAISSIINCADLGSDGFGAELAIGWNGSSGGVRRFETTAKYSNFDWLTNAQIAGSSDFFECAIPRTEIYNDTNLTGKKIALFAMLLNSNGTYYSNQFIPDSCLVTKKLAVINIDNNNDGVLDNYNGSVYYANTDTEYQLTISNSINSETNYYVYQNNAETLNISLSDAINTYQFLIKFNGTNNYVKFSKINIGTINNSDTSNILKFNNFLEKGIQIDAYNSSDSIINNDTNNYILLSFNYTNLSIEENKINLFCLNTSDSKWYKVMDNNQPGGAVADYLNIDRVSNIITAKLKHLSHYYIGEGWVDTVTVVNINNITSQTIKPDSQNVSAMCVYVLADTEGSGDTLLSFAIYNNGNIDTPKIDYVRLYKDSNSNGIVDGGDIFIDTLYYVSSKYWKNNSLNYSISTIGDTFLITIKVNNNANNGDTFQAKIIANTIKSYEEDSGPMSDIYSNAILTVDNVAYYTISGTVVLEARPTNAAGCTIWAISSIDTYFAIANTSGTYAIINVRGGDTYNIYAKEAHHLRNFAETIYLISDTVIHIIPVTGAGDADNNNKINVYDASIVKAKIQTDKADIDGDSDVDNNDLQYVRTNFRQVGD